jgi:type IV secretion system protein VirD4
VKLYLTPSDQKTIEELSQAVGKTTKRVVTRSQSVGRNPFEGRSVIERTEETPLLNEDEARRLDLDEVILVVDAQMPIRARRIKYYEDPTLKIIHAGQQGDHPYPDAEKRQYDARLNQAEEAVAKLAQQLSAVRQGGARGQGPEASSEPKPVLRAPFRRAAVSLAPPPTPINLDLAVLGQTEEGRLAVQKAVLKAEDIIAGYRAVAGG